MPEGPRPSPQRISVYGSPHLSTPRRAGPKAWPTRQAELYSDQDVCLLDPGKRMHSRAQLTEICYDPVRPCLGASTAQRNASSGYFRYYSQNQPSAPSHASTRI